MTWEFPAFDPVLFDLPGPLDVRWYGLMYVVAFVCGQFILTRLARAKLLPVEPERVPDLIFYMVIGTILGGRLGYALFYEQHLLNPAELIKVWQGGLAFHGGLLGVITAMILFARRQQVSWLRVADACAIASTPGIFAVRMANFVNGELYGRKTSPDTFGAMQFPTDPDAMRALGLYSLDLSKREVEVAIRYAYGKVDMADLQATLGPKAEVLAPTLNWDVARSAVSHRHPSQLYEGLGEGLLLGIVLFIVYRLTRTRPLGYGAYGGIFLIGYGVVRFCIEFLRQPDSQFTSPDDPLGTVLLGLTMGQTLCTVMILAGIGLLVWSTRTRVPAASVATI